MGTELVCLVVLNTSITPRISTLLSRLASEMLQRGEKKRSFDSTELECEGTIRTKFEREFLGHFGGVVFQAHLYTNKGEATVKFLLDDRDHKKKGSNSRLNNDSYRHN